MNDELLNTKEVAELLGRSERAIQRMIQKGRIPVAEWRMTGRGRGGKQAFVDKKVLVGFRFAGVAKTMVKKAKQPTKKANDTAKVKRLKSVVSTNDTLTTPNDTLRISGKLSNIRALRVRGTLSFNDVLELYILRKKGFQAQKGEMLHNFSAKNELGNINFDTKELDLGTTNDKLGNINLSSIFDENEEKPKVANDKSGKLGNTNKGKLYQATRIQVLRHISSGKLVSFPDPNDNRKTLIVFNSLDEELKCLYRERKLRSLLKKTPELIGSDDVSDRSMVRKRQQAISLLYNVRENPILRSELISRLCEICGVDKSTLYRWYNKCIADDGSLNLGALNRKRNSNFGKKRVVFDEKVYRYFRSAIFAHKTFSVSASRMLVEAKFNIKFSKRQAFEVVYSDPALRFCFNEREHADKSRWDNKFWTRQTRDNMRPLSLVTTDGHICDVMVIGADGKEFRPMFLEVYDVATGMPLGWAMGRNESRELVSRAIFRAIEKYGHFDSLHQDRGKAFFQSDVQIERIEKYTGIKLVSVAGYSPHLKAHQERNFGGGFEDWLGKLLDGYIGNSVANRHKRSASKDVKAVLGFEEFYKMCEEYVNVVQPNRPQMGLGGMTAVQVWKKWEDNGFRVKRFYENKELLYRSLVIAFGERRQVVMRRGYVAFSKNKELYEFSGDCLVGYEREKLEICFNFDDPRKCFVFFRGKYIGEVIRRSRPKVGEVPDWARLEKIAYNVKRRELKKKIGRSIDKINLYKERKKFLFNNVVGFEPMAEYADISGSELGEVIDTLAADDKKEAKNSAKMIDFAEFKQKSTAELFEVASDVNFYAKPEYDE